jgi:glycosyltransferase involved in cell wall biosynthesis
MRICFLGDGSMNHVARWVNYFVDRGHECFVISLEKGQTFKCPFHCVPMPSWLPPFAKYPLSAPLVSSLIRSFKPDVVNALFIPNYGFVAVILGCHPLAVTTMGSDVLIVPRKSKFHKWRTRYVLARSDLVTSDAWMMTEKIVRFGMDPTKVLTVPMGVDAGIFNADERAPHSFKEPILVSSRQLEPLYNISQLLEATPEILRTIPGARFVIAGTGSEMERLVDMSSRLAITEAVSFPGWLKPDELAALLKKSTVYVSTSTSDSTSVSLLEAMACGAFPVVSNIAGNREWVQDGINGRLFRLGSPTSLAQAIVGALSQSEFVAAAVQKNKEIIEKKALWSDNMTLIENALKMLVS